MITTAAMLPLYHRLGIRRLILACVTMMAGGVMNILPWGGPTARAATALGIDTGDIFIPLVPAMVVGAIWVLFVAYRLGLRERIRLALPGSHDVPETEEIEPEPEMPNPAENVSRPDRLWVRQFPIRLATLAVPVQLRLRHRTEHQIGREPDGLHRRRHVHVALGDVDHGEARGIRLVARDIAGAFAVTNDPERIRPALLHSRAGESRSIPARCDVRRLAPDSPFLPRASS